jgi:hypothetical protein
MTGRTAANRRKPPSPRRIPQKIHQGDRHIFPHLRNIGGGGPAPPAAPMKTMAELTAVFRFFAAVWTIHRHHQESLFL